MSEIVFLYVTAPNADAADAIAKRLIEEKLAACVNIHGEMQSIYEWDGKVERTSETPFFVKTTAAQADAARDRILALHPYDEPCIAALPIQSRGSSQSFLDWIEEATKS